MANAKKTKSRKKIIWIIIGSIVVLLVLQRAFFKKKNPGILVQTEKATLRDITQLVSATGTINPVYQVAITPEVTGEIVELPVKEGDSVKKNQLLIRIKPDTYAAMRDRAKANLQSAEATLRMKKIQMDFIDSDYRRIEELFREGVSQKQEMDRLKSELASSLADYESQKALVLQTEAALKEATESLNKTTIYSPMDGTISQLNVELGERVLGSGFSQGTDIMTVADLSEMEATVDVDENDVVLVALGDTAKIELDAFKNMSYTGVVTQIANSAKTTGKGTQEELVSFEIKIGLKDFNERVRPGMSCNADIEVETKNNILTVPIQSVTARSPEADLGKADAGRDVPYGKETKKKSSKPKEVVFVVEKNLASMKDVKTGISSNEYIEISEGLKEGEEAVSGPYRAISRDLKDKSPVRVESASDKKKDKKPS